MIGFVIVSHSAKLAEGVCELAEQVAQGKVRLAAAGGTNDPENPIGTDAFKVLQAIESVYGEDGVLVLTDLGSAVLSAETALELLDPDKRPRVRLYNGPLVEGAVEAVSQAAAGATLVEIVEPASAVAEGPSEEALVTLPNRLGLHARPAAQFIRLARRFQARVAIDNVDAASINGILSLGARQGRQVRIRAQGRDAREAVAALTAFIESGCGDKDADVPLSSAPVAPVQGQLTGLPASAGIAIGPLAKLHPVAIQAARRTVDDPEAERQRLSVAIRGAREETQELYEWARTHTGENEAGIFDAQALFLEDPAVLDRAARMVRDEHVNAEFAWQTTAAQLCARPADAEDIAARVLRRLTGVAIPSSALLQPAILAAHDLTPSEVKELDPSLVLGLCLETGSASAHSVILARARGIPAVVGLGPGISTIAEGTTVALDGERGIVWVSPSAIEIRDLASRRETWLAQRSAARAERHKPAATRDGHRIRVVANISSVAEAAEALEYGAEGVGVLRTEFLFLGRTVAPSEDEQFEAYRAIAQTLGARPLVIRTLDIGGDKSLPYIQTGEESNPFLGRRGIRVMLGRPDLLRTQLRAILRAGAQALLPMVSSLSELREARAVLPDRDLKMGVMIEVPAAVAIADQLAREADFFSIGTNDLAQYVMAADRTNARVASIADPFQPAVLRTIAQAIAAARHAGIPVALCGELAADPLATPLLLGLGLDEFSVSAQLIPDLKHALARWPLPEAQALARDALTLDSSESVRQFLADPPRFWANRPKR